MPSDALDLASEAKAQANNNDSPELGTAPAVAPDGDDRHVAEHLGEGEKDAVKIMDAIGRPHAADRETILRAFQRNPARSGFSPVSGKTTVPPPQPAPQPRPSSAPPPMGLAGLKRAARERRALQEAKRG